MTRKAWMLAVDKFIELKVKTDRGEEIKVLKLRSMVHQFLDKEKEGSVQFQKRELPK